MAAMFFRVLELSRIGDKRLAYLAKEMLNTDKAPF